MKQVSVQFASGRKIVVDNVIDYVESEEFDVIVTNREEHVTLFRSQMEYMIVKDLEEEPLLATPDTNIMKHFNQRRDIEDGL